MSKVSGMNPTQINKGTTAILKIATYGNNSINVQNYTPISQKRQLSQNELNEISDAKGNLLPKLFASNGDQISSQISNPLLSTLGGGLLGGGLLGGYGALLGKEFGPEYGLAGGLIGGGLGLLGGGTLSYFLKNQKNNNYIDSISRLPEGQTTLRDMKADPVYQQEQNRLSMQHNSSTPFSRY